MNQKIIKICEQKFIYLKYSPRTSENYLIHIKRFLNSVGDKQVIHLSSKDFQNYLDNYNFTSVSQQNQAINAIRFLYKYGLERKYDKVNFQRPRSEKKLPQVIDKDFLLDRISKIENKKHKAIIALAFSTGMRVSEIVNLKISDFDLQRNIIHIKNAKGRKDRIVGLTQKVRQILRDYHLEYKTKEYLFSGQTNSKYSARSCNQIVKKHLGENYHFHTLRHSTFTALAENGTSLPVIQKLAGHSSSKTTEVYIHISNQFLKQVQNPL
ncbi:recombinase XerD [bacterium]|nr:recombinase XerD [bacterium]